MGTGITDRTVDQHVFNLRRKIEPDPLAPHDVFLCRKALQQVETNSRLQRAVGSVPTPQAAKLKRQFLFSPA